VERQQHLNFRFGRRAAFIEPPFERSDVTLFIGGRCSINMCSLFDLQSVAESLRALKVCSKFVLFLVDVNIGKLSYLAFAVFRGSVPSPWSLKTNLYCVFAILCHFEKSLK